MYKHESKEHPLTGADAGERSEYGEMEALFNNISELADVQNQKIKEQLHARMLQWALKKLDELAKEESVSKWEDFFCHLDMEVFCTGEFLYKWGDILSGLKISKKMYRFTDSLLRDAEQYSSRNGIKLRQAGLLPPFDYVKSRLKNPKMKDSTRNILFVTGCVLLWVLTICSNSWDAGKSVGNRRKHEGQTERL